MSLQGLSILDLDVIQELDSVTIDIDVVSPAVLREARRREWDQRFELACKHADGFREEGGLLVCGVISCCKPVRWKAGVR